MLRQTEKQQCLWPRGIKNWIKGRWWKMPEREAAMGGGLDFTDAIFPSSHCCLLDH